MIINKLKSPPGIIAEAKNRQMHGLEWTNLVFVDPPDITKINLSAEPWETTMPRMFLRGTIIDDYLELENRLRLVERIAQLYSNNVRYLQERLLEDAYQTVEPRPADEVIRAHGGWMAYRRALHKAGIWPHF